MIDRLSPRERADLEQALARGEGWARVLRERFLDGDRFRLGIDQAVSDDQIGRSCGLAGARLREALAAAGRWCTEHGLHLLGFPESEPEGAWRHFMAVG